VATAARTLVQRTEYVFRNGFHRHLVTVLSDVRWSTLWDSQPSSYATIIHEVAWRCQALLCQAEHEL